MKWLLNWEWYWLGCHMGTQTRQLEHKNLGDNLNCICHFATS